MASVTIELSPKEVKALKARTGKRSTLAALRAWVNKAEDRRTSAQLRAALTASIKEEEQGKGRRFKSGREAARWLES